MSSHVAAQAWQGVGGGWGAGGSGVGGGEEALAGLGFGWEDECGGEIWARVDVVWFV